MIDDYLGRNFKGWIFPLNSKNKTMNSSIQNNNTKLISVIEFQHLKFENQNDEHVVTLVDAEGFKIIRGYGNSIAGAINDLHHNLI